MKPTTFILAALLAAAPASAHFAFVLPDVDGKHAQLVLNEDLAPSPDVPVRMLAGATLTCTDGAGHDLAIVTHPGEHAITLDLPGTGRRIVHGSADVGILSHDPAHPYHLIYYPKSVVGDPIGRTLGHVPVELTAVGSTGAIAFQFTIADQPTAGAVVTVIRPDGQSEQATTDDAGRTKTFAVPGRYGVWAKGVEPTAGDIDGKHFDETRRYATLVVDAPAIALKPAMPQPAASFGAVVADGYLYVYGGHIVPTHEYSTASVSGQFHRLKLDGGTAWESLPGGPPLQGLNLATDGHAVYRVGGMQPRNAPGKLDDVHSVPDVARYDPAAGRWDNLLPLPHGRSSHDVVVVDHTLFVVGGWELTGDSDDATFAHEALSLDLSAPDAKWRSIPQPFERRALTVAVHGGKVYAIGGFEGVADPTLKVDLLDPATGQWTPGPALPGPDRNGFGPAAASVGNDLYVSVGDGSVFRLNDKRYQWDKVAAATPRIVHRAVVDRSRLLILGGAAGRNQLHLIEAVPVVR